MIIGVIGMKGHGMTYTPIYINQRCLNEDREDMPRVP